MEGKKLNQFFNGYIVVRVECLNPEKFINMSIRHGVELWDIKKISFTTIEFKMHYYQYKNLKSIVRRTSSKVRIVKRYGVNFILSKAQRRKFFSFGVVIFLFIILSLSSIVWRIEIEGNKKVNKNVIYNALNKAGLKEGKVKYSIDLRQVENSVIKSINEVSVVNIRFYGTKALVKVVERTMPPQIVPFDKPTNIVARKEGVISKIISYKGQCTVTEGEYVRKGQILISGTVTNNENLPLKLVHSMGSVKANTWYESIKDAKLDYKYEIRSGRMKEIAYYILGNKRFYVKRNNIDFKKYDKIEEKSNLKVGSFNLPITKVTEHVYEKIDKYKKITYNEAYNIALKEAENEASKLVPKGLKIKDKKIEKRITTGNVRVRVLYIVEEDIGLEEVIN